MTQSKRTQIGEKSQGQSARIKIVFNSPFKYTSEATYTKKKNIKITYHRDDRGQIMNSSNTLLHMNKVLQLK